MAEGGHIGEETLEKKLAKQYRSLRIYVLHKTFYMI